MAHQRGQFSQLETSNLTNFKTRADPRSVPYLNLRMLLKLHSSMVSIHFPRLTIRTLAVCPSSPTRSRVRMLTSSCVRLSLSLSLYLSLSPSLSLSTVVTLKRGPPLSLSLPPSLSVSILQRSTRATYASTIRHATAAQAKADGFFAEDEMKRRDPRPHPKP